MIACHSITHVIITNMIKGRPMFESFLALFQFWKYHKCCVFERLLSLNEHHKFVISS